MNFSLIFDKRDFSGSVSRPKVDFQKVVFENSYQLVSFGKKTSIFYVSFASFGANSNESPNMNCDVILNMASFFGNSSHIGLMTGTPS